MGSFYRTRAEAECQAEIKNRYEGNPMWDYHVAGSGDRWWLTPRDREVAKQMEPSPPWLVKQHVRERRRKKAGKALQKVGVGVYLLFALGVTSTASCWTCIDGVISPALLLVLGIATALVAVGMWLNGELPGRD